ncbi:MAG: sigma-54 dependent transcriptional regulator [Candidatus Omnitrophota bacterium]
MMDKFNEILLDVWREACRHIEISESTVTIAQMLVRHLPLSQVIVMRVNPERSRLDAAAFGLSAPPPLLGETGRECSSAQMKALQNWRINGGVRHRLGDRPFAPDLNFLLPMNREADFLAGPLRCPSGALGILLLIAAPGRDFQERHALMMEILLEPFAIALDNDHRLREMAALREAAEADKRSLLNRLGRRDLGDTIIGADTTLRSVMERVDRVAASNVPVLIFGETGTGKELVARAIHKRSPRASGPIMRVNCGAIPPELIDSQLFGHERGAFTGAVETYRGWFERADEGTLFLDEIGELPLNVQVRLLRILQDGWLERVGGRQPIKVDVRLVAATHRDLASMVGEGRFREDLWYRIAVFPIFLPPLRDRFEDMPVMANYFAERSAIRFGLPALLPTQEDIELLTSYSWPGNIRELGAIMDRAALIGNGRRLDVAKALGVMNLTAGKPSKAFFEGETPPTSDFAFLPLDEAVRRHIEAALVRTNGRIEGRNGAAALLRINPHTLRARMRKLRIDWRRFRFSSPASETEKNPPPSALQWP